MSTPPDDQTIRIWTRTLRALRLIAALTGERMVQVLDRLVSKELGRIQEADPRGGSKSRNGPKMSEGLRKSFKYKLKATPEQERELERVLGRCCQLDHVALDQRKTAYERCHLSTSRSGQEAELKDLRAELRESAGIQSPVLQDVLARLDKTFQAFFRRVASAEKAGYPRLRPRSRYKSLTSKAFGNGVTLDTGLLVLSKIGHLALRWSRPIEGTPKTVTISREADGWYVCFSCAEVPVQPLPPSGQEMGIDVGLESFATLADGTCIPNPRWSASAQWRRKTAQRGVSRRKKGSHRRRKAVMLLGKAHLKVKRQRADFHHKTALALVQENDTIDHDDVQTANRLTNHHLATSISDAGWSACLGILAANAAYAGRRVVAVPPADPSQRCSGCGRRVWKGLSVRWHQCPYEDCGTRLHRDHTAARTILRLGHCTEERAGHGPSGRRGGGCVGEPSIRRA